MMACYNQYKRNGESKKNMSWKVDESSDDDDRQTQVFLLEED